MSKLFRFFILLILISISNSSYSLDVKTYIPEKAKIYMPVVVKEQNLYFKDINIPWYFGGLIEQESCLSLTNKRCFDPSSKLDTSREIGLGLGQITKAFNKDGSIRFDALTEMKTNHKNELGEMTWNNIAIRPDLQVRTIILMIKDNYNYFYKVKDELERFKFSDAGYNGGKGGTAKERTQCGLTKGCDPQVWNNNVEKVCLKSKKPLYGNRNACDINREHVTNVFNLRMNKYKVFFVNK